MLDSSKQAILLVDDDEVQLAWSKKILVHHGYKVDIARSAEKGLELISKQPYDLIVSDLMMPGMSGIDFVREIGSFEKDYKVVLMTGHADVDTFIESVYGLGALEYIVKPIDGKDFIEIVCKLTSNDFGNG
ncbi:MAG TPA: response regulator [Nitrospinota bacterium]|jgi:DNA-binding NtrC family response regulator|nr:response regulator [Nitrospinota bacterium]|tara:strand:- start:111258 stop:111650 length:393 start_codon:yes stop_codon:yes gene_type:complete